jgi:phage tail sheath protein FI
MMALICPIDFASAKPAEFVIFRLTQNGERELTSPFTAPFHAREA